MARRTLNQFAITPHRTPIHFRAVFALANDRWPGKKLSLIGVENGITVLMQEWGNPARFELALVDVRERAESMTLEAIDG